MTVSRRDPDATRERFAEKRGCPFLRAHVAAGSTGPPKLLANVFRRIRPKHECYKCAAAYRRTSNNHIGMQRSAGRFRLQLLGGSMRGMHDADQWAGSTGLHGAG